MANEMPEIAGFVLPLALTAGGFVVGLVCEKLLRLLLRGAVARTGWAGGGILLRSGRGLITLWFTLAGLHAIVLARAVRPEVAVFIDRLILAVVISSATVVLARVAAALVRLYADREESFFGSTTIFVHLTQIFVFLLGGLILLQSLGISITPILTALGVGGLAVALALQDTLSNLFSGLYITVSGQIRPGDYIRLDSGQEGYVTDITWRSTTLEALQGNRIVIPNVKLAAAIVTNFSLPRKDLALALPIKVAHDSDLALVEEITMTVARETVAAGLGAVPEAEPVVRFSQFTPIGVELVLVVRAKEFVDQFLLRHELIKRLHVRYREAGIVFAFAPFLPRGIKDKDDEKSHA
ncbi:MAG: mechanosensitive ion channel family protein [Firmicutes bacterium]|nr:mechanosensitive ion channel family protein [Bacillota bacterium]